MPSPRSTLRFEELLPSLKRQCEEKLGRFEAGSDAELIGELTRALLYLWLYFEEECAKRASMVRGVASCHNFVYTGNLHPVLWVSGQWVSAPEIYCPDLLGCL